jgi:glucuronoarabinoxylan endo-1,4-beta-xylanase
VQNEPDVTVSYESCDWNASEMIRFLKENAPSVGTKIIAPESYQFRKELSDPLLNDALASANLDIVGGHMYGGGLEPYPLAESKGKEIWMTEYLDLETDWSYCFLTGREILDCMNAGMSAYIWWYIVRFYGPIYDDGSHPDTPAQAIPGEISKRGYVMSQFARFVRPGFYRVEVDENPQDNVFLTAFKGNQKIVIVVANSNRSSTEQSFFLNNGTAAKFTPYVTSETKNCIQESDISVSDGSFTAILDGSSITTFVSNE